MATIRSYTTIEQSKVLAKILPLESADMYYASVPVREWKDKENTSKGIQVVFKDKIFAIENLRNHEIGEGDVCAWSLATLLSNLPDGTDITKGKADTENEKYMCVAEAKGDIVSTFGNNPVDACCEMIMRLNELKML